MKNFILLARGLPGSGKTSLTEMIGIPTISGIMSRPVSCSADDYFVDDDGQYNFDPKHLPEAHNACQSNARSAMVAEKNVVVHNTFTQRWEMQPYIELAKEFDYRLIVVSTFDGGCSDEELAHRNTHGVPLDSIASMRSRWEQDWKAADTRPPWERQ
tara:strand:- start:172 stop:642 length:471 start_codon:yes stop_codon:yes gene_type:complete